MDIGLCGHIPVCTDARVTDARKDQGLCEQISVWKDTYLDRCICGQMPL